MTSSVVVPTAEAAAAASLVVAAGQRSAEAVLAGLGVDPRRGLDDAEVERRRAAAGPNTVTSHGARFGPVLWQQLRSPLLGLLLAAAVTSFFVGERSAAVLIGVIVALSVGLGFVNEYRAERTADTLHSQVHHKTVALRNSAQVRVDVTTLVPGDLVTIGLGDIVPADLRLLQAESLACDESVLTGESLPAGKSVAAVAAGTAVVDLVGCALMGTVVSQGSGRGVVVATGRRTEFGAIAAGLATHPPETPFQAGLARLSLLLVYVAAVLTTSIFVINVLLDRPVIDSLLFSLAIAVGITPQLLPAVVSSSLAAGSRRMSRRKVLVKRLVCIEDLGDLDVLFTDKTGTLTEGRVSFSRAIGAGVAADPTSVLRWGLLCTENGDSAGRDGAGVAGNPLDRALWDCPPAHAVQASVAGFTQVGVLPFDHDRQLVSVVVADQNADRTLVTKGAPEVVLDRCLHVPAGTAAALAEEFAAGNRVVAVATRQFDRSAPTAADEHGLELMGLLVFLDPVKADAADALRRLSTLGITVKVVTGDNPVVAEKVCAELGIGPGATLTGAQVGAMDDAELGAAIAGTTVFARVGPQDKARIVNAQRGGGSGVAFLGDGVNDALALHAADVGISVDSATDVAKDAADVILLEKSLDVLAGGVVEGRRIFANTIKYVLMGTSSNFGNMFSAAGASLFLGFLPMLPSQILLNNLRYDTSQLAIPTDEVDEEQLRRPSHWDIAFIRRFMFFFGPLSSLFDAATFVVMLAVFHSGATQFRTGWFVESLATQTLIIFAIRTRRVPFFRSRPSLPLTLAALGVTTVGIVLPATPFARTLGFSPLPGGFFLALLALAAGYLVIIEFGKRWFYRTSQLPTPSTPTVHTAHRGPRRLLRRVAYFTDHRRPRHTASPPAHHDDRGGIHGEAEGTDVAPAAG